MIDSFAGAKQTRRLSRAFGLTGGPWTCNPAAVTFVQQSRYHLALFGRIGLGRCGMATTVNHWLTLLVPKSWHQCRQLLCR